MLTSTSTDTRRILVLANETLGGAVLHETLRASAQGGGRVLVVAPALNRRLSHWLSDTDGARGRAEERLHACLASLAAAGIDAEGMIGDADPLQAALDALALFGADEIVVSTHPEEQSNWLARGLVQRLCAHTDLPVLHVVVRPAREPAPRSRVHRRFSGTAATIPQ
jgi:hypothetical protein